ncbi:hypothetical protein [Zoogloea sp.]|jgi:hypothetical protein|uniref:hypothetical protein n=1 Tax=Zoogloea sp. TaxID=49181 RepID=UPI0035B0ADF1
MYRLLLASPRQPEAPRLVAEHLDPAWLKQRGYEIARTLGDAAALWAARPGTERQLALHCRTGHALAIVSGQPPQ